MIRQSFAMKQVFFLAMAVTSLAQPGFISIDCGLKQNSSYTELSGITYSPDFGYVDGGVNANVSNVPDLPEDMYRTMRTFPNGTRNCYTVGPVTEGATYLVRASFFYGNYDGQNNPPTFDLHLGVNFWTTVETHDYTEFAEIIATALYHAFDVCLVRTGFGTPFISVLEVRPVNNSDYEIVDSSHALVVREGRLDYGGNQITRYPDDAYDRFWFPSEIKTGWKVVRTDKEIVINGSITAKVPLTVLRTAIVSDHIDYFVAVGADEKIVQFLYLVELEELPGNETRGLSVLQNGEVVYEFYGPRYLTPKKLKNSNTEIQTTGSYTLKSMSNSTWPPYINARELYGLKRLETTLTDAQDREAISKIKQVYGVRKNWQGDPCLPRDFSWEGVGCLYDASANSKIVSLNLSGSGLTGGISPSIVNLAALTSLDLSSNSLAGNIPEILVNLQNLEVLNLAKNGLNGSLPDVFYKKAISGALTLNIEGNTELCKNVDLCRALNMENTEITENKKLTVPIALGVSLCVILLVGAGILIWWLKGRKPTTDQSAVQEENPRQDSSSSNSLLPQLNLQSHEFSFSDIIFITKNFGRLIGKGGFATVYHGSLNDGTEVAVKLLSKTSRRRKDFHAEEQILTRVHHKNLVRLLGYCDDKDNLALVYEYMRKGALAEHLRNEEEGDVLLDWSMRLRVAVDVAQGLDYLHHFCKPPIIHRDIKTRNILLDEHFEAKLGDFGLSKLFSNDNAPPVSTVVAGTPGYLDPEYYQTSTLTEKSDVYSFGIVLLEIITGRSPTDNDAREGPLLLWVMSKLERGDIESIVDRRFIGGYNSNSMWKVLEVAIKCSSSLSAHRPNMSEVVSELKECLESETSGEKSDQLSIQMPKPDVSLVIPAAR